MDNGIFGVCPHCGIRTIDNRMILSYSKEYYICTNHKTRMGNPTSKIVPINMLRPYYNIPKVEKLSIPNIENRYSKFNWPRENSVSWEVTRRYRWKMYANRWRKIEGKLTNQKQNSTLAEFLMMDKCNGSAKLASVLEEPQTFKEKAKAAQERDIHYREMHHYLEINS